jgi:hypothetical protein
MYARVRDWQRRVKLYAYEKIFYTANMAHRNGWNGGGR